MRLKKYFKALIAGLIFFGLALIVSRSYVHCGEKTMGKEISAPMETASYTNRLIHEKSPYLLQHAHNPVAWFPWGEEAFKKAREEDKPIFLSIGYSTCHWCHVMEEESFSDPKIAEIMNKHFVSIKVDREERPDVDNIYMTAVQALTRSGGWPLTVFLTPDLKPFYGGTYFPPEDRWGRPGLVSVLNAIAEKWKTSREEVLKSGESLARAISLQSKTKGASTELDENILSKAYQYYKSQFDSKYGGFGSAPKFPRSHDLSFLLRYWNRTGDPHALEMVEKTLIKMAKGGMYDHLGGGFHRYSTDERWHVPHFEKMLYDQAILSKSYLEVYQATGNKEYAEIAKDIFEYVLRDMTPPPAVGPAGLSDKVRPLSGGTAGGGVTDPLGAFYSAEDADSAPDPAKPHEKSEGAFYVWTYDEILKILGEKEARYFNYIYGVKAGGNVASDPHGEFKNGNILYMAHSMEEASKEFEVGLPEIERDVAFAKQKLFKERAKRLRPHLDDKILTDWNGLMISSLAFGSRVLAEPRYRDAAQKAADFMLSQMKRKDGRLLHRYREGDSSIPGFLEDYAFFSHGLFDLYEATFDPKYLEEGKDLAKEMVRLFWDEAGGGFFFTAKDSEKLIARTKELYDGAIPSGNSVATLSLLRIGRLTMDRELEKWAEVTLDAFSENIAQYPSGYPQMLIALDFAIGPSREIVIAGEVEESATQDMIRAIHERFIPNKVVALHPKQGEKTAKIESLSPFLKEQIALGGKPTAYVCKNYVCSLPTTDVSKMVELLKDEKGSDGE